MIVKSFIISIGSAIFIIRRKNYFIVAVVIPISIRYCHHHPLIIINATLFQSHICHDFDQLPKLRIIKIRNLMLSPSETVELSFRYNFYYHYFDKIVNSYFIIATIIIAIWYPLHFSGLKELFSCPTWYDT